MLNLFGYVEDSIVDGPGLRTVIFVQGCPHHCKGCHNPESWSFDTNTLVSVESLADRITQNPLCKGITLSGGEPFSQASELVRLLDLLSSHLPNYEIACYTGGKFEDYLTDMFHYELLRRLDILIDQPFIQKYQDLTLKFRGSSNQRILDVPASITANKAVWTKNIKWL